MQNSRRKAFGILLSISLILSGCGNGGNQTDTNEGGKNMSDINKEVVNEDVTVNETDQTIEPRTVSLIGTSLTDSLHKEISFHANIANGKYVRVAIQSYNDAKINVLVYLNNKYFKTYPIRPGEKYLERVFPISQSTDFRVICEVINGIDMSVYFNAKQYISDPS